VRDRELRWLTAVILFHDRTRDYRFKPGPRRMPPPLTLQATYLCRAVRAGYAVVDVREVGQLEARCAERRVVALWLPVPKAGNGCLRSACAAGTTAR
jgi:hypothetical protein